MRAKIGVTNQKTHPCQILWQSVFQGFWSSDTRNFADLHRYSCSPLQQCKQYRATLWSCRHTLHEYSTLARLLAFILTRLDRSLCLFVNLILVQVLPFPTHLAIPSPITSSCSHSPLCTSITPSLFHSRLKTYLFHKSYSPPRSFTSYSRNTSTDVCLDRFFWATRFFILFFPLFFVSGPCARLSWPSRQVLSAR